MSVVEVEKFRNATMRFDLEGEVKPESVARRELAAKLGLNRQREFVEPRPDDAARVFGEITGKEREVWVKFLPTAYRRSAGHWANYRFDVVPAEVLEEIDTADRMGVFHDLEIWTPEWFQQHHRDPMVVGVIYPRLPMNRANARFFPIVRWGESLKPFEEIVEAIKLRISRREALQIAGTMVFVSSVIGLIGYGFITFIGDLIRWIPG